MYVSGAAMALLIRLGGDFALQLLRRPHQASDYSSRRIDYASSKENGSSSRRRGIRRQPLACRTSRETVRVLAGCCSQADVAWSKHVYVDTGGEAVSLVVEALVCYFLGPEPALLVARAKRVIETKGPPKEGPEIKGK